MFVTFFKMVRLAIGVFCSNFTRRFVILLSKPSVNMSQVISRNKYPSCLQYMFLYFILSSNLNMCKCFNILYQIMQQQKIIVYLANLKSLSIFHPLYVGRNLFNLPWSSWVCFLVTQTLAFCQDKEEEEYWNETYYNV